MTHDSICGKAPFHIYKKLVQILLCLKTTLYTPYLNDQHKMSPLNISLKVSSLTYK